MNNEYAFTPFLRNKKKHCNINKETNKIPCIIYGNKFNQMIYINQNDCKSIIALTNNQVIFKINLNDEDILIVIKDIKRHPIKLNITHIDFQKIKLKDIIKLTIPFKFTNEKKSVGVLAGGHIIKHMNFITIKGPAENIPPFIKIDLLNLTVNKSFVLKNIQLPEKVQIPIINKKQNLNLLIVSIIGPRTLIESKEDKEKGA